MAPSWSLGSALRGMFSRGKIDDETWDDLEDALIGADFGPDLTDAIVDELRGKVAKFRTDDPADLQRMLREIIEERLARLDPTLTLSNRPAVVLVVGVNGVGKTTTIGKFAKFLRNYDKTVLVGAADTFRAAAVEQLVDLGRARGRAGRAAAAAGPGSRFRGFPDRRAGPARRHRDRPDRHRRTPADQERPDGRARARCAGSSRSSRRSPRCCSCSTRRPARTGSPRRRRSSSTPGVTGLVLTKLDGSAKGGFVLAVQEKTGIPIKLVGQGEGIGDLTGFTPHVFAQQLVG